MMLLPPFDFMKKLLLLRLHEERVCEGWLFGIPIGPGPGTREVNVQEKKEV